MSSSQHTLAAPRARFRLKLRVAIGVSLIFVTISLATAMALINYHGTTAALRTATGALMASSVEEVAAHTEALLSKVAGQVEVSTAVLTLAEIAQDLDAVEALLFALVASTDDLFYAQFGTADGRFVLVGRNAEGGLDSKWVLDGRTSWIRRAPGQGLRDRRIRQPDPDSRYDPRRRPWYRGAIRTDGIFWTRAYAHADSGEAVVTAARAIYRASGEPLGVVSATLALSHLNGYLRRLATADTVLFLADERGQLVALSAGTLPIDRSNPAALRLPHVAEAPFPQVAAFGLDPGDDAPTAGDPEVALQRLAIDQRTFLALEQALTPMAGRRWTVGAVVEEDAVLAEVRSLLSTSAVVAAAVIIVFVLLGLALARTLASPLMAIARETRRIEQLDLEDRQLEASPYEEIAEIQEAYAHLRIGLRAFEKYVPVKLVRTLLAERVDPEPGGEVREVTLFFSDIRGFTSFAHSISASELAEILSLYLQTIVDEIERTGGTIDKFVGDGVMAFWNAPRAVSDHPLMAVRAAVRCRDAIGAMGRSRELFTRIGIHTGEAIVGNFGSRSRFSYTALGDAVNLAARLEAVNKYYGTEILVSAATEARLDDSIIRRRLDRIAVAGRQEGFDVYEVAGLAGEVSAEVMARIRHYEAAFDCYLAGRFAEAQKLFEATASEDPAAHALARRCASYREAPPPEDWNGVYALLHK